MIKSFRELAKKYSKDRTVVRDEQGRAVAEMAVRDDGGFLSPYSLDEQERISDEVAAFIEESTAPIPVREELCLRIYSNVISEEEKTRYGRALKKYYSDRYAESAFEIKKLHAVAVVMFIIGVLALGGMIVWKIFQQNAILNEIVDIFAWVFLWESVDVYFLQCGVLRAKQRRYLSILNADIEFYSL